MDPLQLIMALPATLHLIHQRRYFPTYLFLSPMAKFFFGRKYLRLRPKKAPCSLSSTVSVCNSQHTKALLGPAPSSV